MSLSISVNKSDDKFSNENNISNDIYTSFILFTYVYALFFALHLRIHVYIKTEKTFLK